jgi:hypothetical protein
MLQYLASLLTFRFHCEAADTLSSFSHRLLNLLANASALEIHRQGVVDPDCRFLLHPRTGLRCSYDPALWFRDCYRLLDDCAARPPLPTVGRPGPLSSDPPVFEEVLVTCCASELAAQVMIAGHHGSRTSSRRTSLDAVGASVFVVSSGPTKYGSVVLPDADIVSELQSRGQCFARIPMTRRAQSIHQELVRITTGTPVAATTSGW